MYAVDYAKITPVAPHTGSVNLNKNAVSCVLTQKVAPHWGA